jgi:2-enoate reductase
LVHLAAQVKGTVKIPVIAVARLGIPELAEQILKDRKADMIALGRTLLADPHWPKKVHEGKVGDIRPCTGCNDGCLQRIFESKPLSCAVNPATGKERLYIPKVVKKLERVLIAGGGIAGMEAARVAAIRGCEVTLYEKSEKLGGHLIAASVPDFKQDYRRLIDWYNTQLEKLGIEIKFQFEVTRELVKKEKPDKVIVATGSTPVIPNVKGIEKPMVASCIDLLLGRKKAGTTVSVIGGGLVGCETALWLARQGKKVTVVEMLPEMATGIFFSNRVMLLEMLRQSNVRLMPNAMLEEVVDEGIKVVDTNFGQKIIPCDTVALAIGLKPRRELYESLRKDITELYLVGDCREPRKILHAIWDAYTVAGG